MATWIETTAGFFKHKKTATPQLKSLPHLKILLGIFIYELFLGFVSSCLHPLLGIFLAAVPFLFMALLFSPVWAYCLFIIAIQFSNISFGQVGSYNVRVIDIGFFLLFFVFLVRALSDKSFVIPKTGIDLSLWVFLTWILLSFTWSFDRTVGIEALIKIFIGVITFYMTVFLICDRSKLDMAMNVWVLAGVISALAAIYEFRTVAVHHIIPGMTKWATPIRSQGFFGGPIMLGSFLTLAIVINYAQILKATTPFKKSIYFITCGLMIIGLFTTLSRNDIAAWFLVTVFFNIRFKNMRLPTAAILGVMLLLGSLLTGMKLFSVFWNRFFYLFKGLEESSPMRMEIWWLTLRTISDYPILGTGIGGFTAVAKAEPKYGSLIYPHSMILYILVELGMIGFTFITYFVFRIFRMVRIYEKDLRSNSDRAIVSAMTGGLLIHLFWTISQNITFQHIIFWAFLGISFAGYQVVNQH